MSRNAYHRKYYKKNSRKILRQRIKSNPNYDRVRRYRIKFGITLAEYEKMFEIQNGRCLICGKTSKRRLAVDHNHITSKVRGLLCSSCNVGLGMFYDNPALLESAIAYLRTND